MKKLRGLIPILVVMFSVISCNKKESNIAPKKDTGFLKLSVALNIEAEPAARKQEVVDLSNYKVTIYHSEDNSIAQSWDHLSDVPEEVELETGMYYVEASSNNLQDAAFDNPYYYGRSDDFTIDKEELKEISVTCTLANYFVTFDYSDNIKSDFNEYGAVVTITGTDVSLDYGNSEELEGYFAADKPVDIVVTLTYHKVFEDQDIVRRLTASIPDPQPKTHYIVHADAHLDNGKIVIDVTIDDQVNVIDVQTSEVPVLNGPANPETIGATFEESGADFVKGEKIWTFSNVAFANYNRIFWGPVIGAMKASLDGPVYDNNGLNETLDFVPANSDLVNGVLFWAGTTRIHLATNGSYQPVDTRLRMQITELDGTTPVPLVDPADEGMPANIGGLARFTDGTSAIVVHFELEAKYQGAADIPANWKTFDKLFDDAPTFPGEAGSAVGEFTGGFYWDQQL